MSAEKDYNEKPETNENNKKDKKNDNRKKRKKSRAAVKIILFLLLIIAILVALLYFDPFGFGTGGFGLNGNGAAQSSVGAQAQTTAAPAADTSAAEAKVTEPAAPFDMQITINGATYLYNGNEVSIDDIIAEAKKHDNNVKITLNDQSATVNAVEDIKKALDENKLAYVM